MQGRTTRTALLLFLAALALPALAGAAPGSWPSGGHDISNTHSNPAETKLNADNVGKLAVKWTSQVHGDVSGNPAVVDGAVYVPDWGGYLNKINAATGQSIWSNPMSTYTGVYNDAARAAPTVVMNTVYVGDQGTQPYSAGGGYLSAVNATTGAAVWTTKVDDHPFAILTAGPLYYNGVLYQGVASSEEGVAVVGNYPCCTFRGSIVAVDAGTGAIKWKTYTVPGPATPCTSQAPASGCSYSGNGVWGTTPAVDPATNTLYITTGNNYTVPDSVKACEAAGNSAGDCLAPNDYVDSVLALDATTGAVKWATGLQGFDDWNVACIPGVGSPNNCPTNPGPDYDFGSGPNLFTINGPKGQKQLVVGAGEKSGEYWALDAATGKILWGQAAGPGATLGGIEWGPATDGKRIYIAEENFNGTPYDLPSGASITSGSWAAIEPSSGKILWQVADPSHNLFGGGNALGAVAAANGVVYAPSMSGDFYALDAANGKTLWHYTAAGAAISGAAIVDGVVYWGSGYTHLGIPGWTGSTTFYAFSLNGK
jgi:polyvinyl alcohol dehydrogenase (cytochrome)